MTKASSLFVLLFFVALITQVKAQGHHHQGYQGQAQSSYSPAQVISQSINQIFAMGESRRVAELLRLSMSESRGLTAISLTMTASARGQAMVEILNRGRPQSQPQIIRGRMNQVSFPLPAGTNLEDLELRVQSEVMVDSLSAEVQSTYNPAPAPRPRLMQPMSGQMLRLELRQEIRYGGEIPLKRLVEEQLAITLEGAQIERVAVQGMVTRGMAASVQVEMNNRLVSPVKSISPAQGITPLPINSFEEVQSSLKLLVSGDVVITQINIRVGQVRVIQTRPNRTQRIQVSQQVSSGRPLELSRLLPYENRLISSLVLEARTAQMSQAEVVLLSMGQVLASAIVSQVPMRPVLQLMRPMPLRDLQLNSFSPVIIDALEIGFADY
jgi:hypothetical protein